MGRYPGIEQDAQMVQHLLLKHLPSACRRRINTDLLPPPPPDAPWRTRGQVLVADVAS